MDHEEQIDNALAPFDFPVAEWCHAQAIGDKAAMENISSKYSAMDRKAKKYKQDLKKASSEEEKQVILASVTRE